MKTQNYTIGMDLGDNRHDVCIIDGKGDVIERSEVENTRKSLTAFLEKYPGAQVIMEAGTHSPWISRHLKRRGMRVLVANPRKLRAIYDTDNKTDERDAEMLARIGRFDPKMLYPVSHNSEACQRALGRLKSRDALVNSRTALINAVRGLLKSQGTKLPSNWSSEQFAKKALGYLNEEDLGMVKPLLDEIATLTERIRGLEKEITRMIEQEYPEAQHLQKIPGVGPLTALSFVLVIERQTRFRRARDIGPFLGLTPKRDQSGDVDKALRISKAGNKMLRRLLVNCAQYLMGPFGPSCSLRDHGQRIARGRGGIAKKKAVIAVARKLSMVMLVMWKNPGMEFEAFPKKQAQAA